MPRLLEEDGNSTSDEEIQYDDKSILRDTAILYGSIFAVVWILFCWVRLKYPRPYTVRKWTEKEELKVNESRKMNDQLCHCHLENLTFSLP